MKLATNTPLDKLLDGGIETDAITNIYGPAGSGKTNIAISTTLANEKKTIYIDTEGSFSLERFTQLGGNEKLLKKLIFIEIATWGEQNEKVKNLLSITDGVGLIVIDSIVALYRLELSNDNFQHMNRQLATQYSMLSSICRKFKIPVLVTNQVYSMGDNVELTSRTIGKYWSKALVELKKTERDSHRLAILRKHRSLPEGRKIEFIIEQNGLKEAKKWI
jgi:DNA repair protein RadB